MPAEGRRNGSSRAACSSPAFLSLPGPRALAPAPQPLPYTNTHRHTDTSLPVPFPVGLPAREAKAGLRRSRAPAAPRPTVVGCAGSGGGVVPRRRALLLPPPHAVPRPGRLCPMRNGVAGRWRVFLFWVEVEAEEREDLATISRRRRRRRGRWRRPSRSGAVFPPRRRSLADGPCPPLLCFLPVPELPGLPGAPRLCTPLAAAPGPGRTRRPHEEGRERSDQEQV